MDPLTLFALSIVGASALEVMRGRRAKERFEEDYPDTAAGRQSVYRGWIRMVGEHVDWAVEPGSAVWIEAEMLRPIPGNIFDPEKAGSVAAAVRQNTGEHLVFMAPYGQVSRVDLDDVAESLRYRDDLPFTTGDRAADAWLSTNDLEEASGELLAHLEGLRRAGSGSFGRWTARIRDGNHRTFGAVLGGEKRVAVRLYDNDIIDIQEALRASVKRPYQEQRLELLEKAVADTGAKPEWLHRIGGPG